MVEKRREHSRKPDGVHERIEQLVGGPYLELFCREDKERLGAVGAIKLVYSTKALSERAANRPVL